MQYLDNLDDLIGALGLVAERLRSLALFVSTLVVFAALVLGGILLASSEPPLALATVILLLVTLMYRTATNLPERRQTT